MKCLNCGYCLLNTKNKFCNQSCAATYNNRKRKLKNSKPIINCIICDAPTKNNICCSYKCLGKYNSKIAYQNFLNNNGSDYEYSIGPTNFKKYILSEQDYKCAICGIDNTWNGIKLIFIMDHINGDPYNNQRSNLRLICPNCDSQLDTYKAKNKGNGRLNRRQINKNIANTTL